ncbi:MAG: riboflavin synthase [Flavobacteriaceae bacterium]|nr:riboflavin synthase [Flavobacteriaceae bacterium]
MFTGIIEAFGEIINIIKEKDNIHFTIKSKISNELKIDQSLSHDGICLTVVAKGKDVHTVTAIRETLTKTNLGQAKIGDKINLERAMQLGDRLDGHIVQGHVDQVGTCIAVMDQNGSTFYTFSYEPMNDNITIEKGSVTVNGVSLTVVNSKDNNFGVAIIPYTRENTNFSEIKIGDKVNLEFDVIGKYVARLMQK